MATGMNLSPKVQKGVIDIADGTNTITLDQAHAGKLLLLLDASLAITLPEATGSGDVFEVVMGIAATAVTIVTADTANAGYHGFIMGTDTDAAGSYNWSAVGTEDTITLNGVATGGKIYDRIKLTDIATDKWLVEGQIQQSGASEATPFSSAA